MHLLEGRHHIVVPCSPGVTPFLARELRDLKMPIIEERSTSVTSKGDFSDVLRLNLNLAYRTAGLMASGLFFSLRSGSAL